MFCLNCGQKLPPDAAFCPNCGRKAEAPLNTPETNVSVQTYHIDSDTSDRIKSCINHALIITILATFGCGAPFNLVLGIAAIVYAYNADGNLKSGDIEKAKQCAKTSKTLYMIAIAVIVFQVFFTFFIVLLYILIAGLAIISG